MPSPSKTQFKVIIPSSYSKTKKSYCQKSPENIVTTFHNLSINEDCHFDLKLEKYRSKAPLKPLGLRSLSTDRLKTTDRLGGNKDNLPGGQDLCCCTLPRPVINNSMNSTSQDSGSLIETLQKCSHGRVKYDRENSLIEDDTPTFDKISNQRALHKLCSKENLTEAPKSRRLRGRTTRSPLKYEETIIDRTLNSSLAAIDSLEILNDTQSLREIERKSKRSNTGIVERAIERQEEHFRCSAKQSLNRFEERSERTREKLAGQFSELQQRKEKRAAEEKKQEQSAQASVSTYLLAISEIVSVAKKCVLDNRHPEIGAVISALEGHVKKCDSQTSGAYNAVAVEAQMRVRYNQVLALVERLNSVIVRLNEEQRQAASIQPPPPSITQPTAAPSYASPAPKPALQPNPVRASDLQPNPAHTPAPALQPHSDPSPTAPTATYNAAPTAVSQDPSAAPAASIPQGITPAAPQTTSSRPSEVVSNSVVDSSDVGSVVSKAHIAELVESNIVGSVAYEEYQRLEKQLKAVEKGLQNFLKQTDRDLVKMRSQLKLITVTPINTISASSHDHMATKVKEISSILRGKKVTRNMQVTDSGINSTTLNFCILTAAIKFVEQACEQVGNAENLIPAYSFGTVLLGIWQQNAVFGELFLGQLHRQCPYTVPAYWSRGKEESNHDYLKRLGYSEIDGKLEEKEKFLKKMEGCMKLYGAIITATPPYQGKVSPYGISHGWIWLSRMLNMQPIPDITATVLHAFLVTTSHAMARKYGLQFLKLLDLMHRVYLPKLEEVSESFGPVTRLKLFLEKAIKDRSFPDPDGVITEHIIPV